MPKKFLCEFCPKRFGSKQGLRSHQRAKHIGSRSRSSSRSATSSSEHHRIPFSAANMSGCPATYVPPKPSARFIPTEELQTAEVAYVDEGFEVRDQGTLIGFAGTAQQGRRLLEDHQRNR